MWTAITPEAVFTVRTYATRRDHRAGSPRSRRTKCGYDSLTGPRLHSQVRPPWWYGVTWSRSHLGAARRQPGAVQVGLRIW